MQADRLWHIITTLQRAYGWVDSDALVAIAGLEHRAMAKRYVLFLTRESVLRKVGDDFKVIRPGSAPPIARAASTAADAAQQAMWTALRCTATTTAEELAMAASSPDRLVSPITARAWLAALERCRLVYRLPGTRSVRLLPRSNTGPRAPILLENGYFDINLMRAVNVTASSPVNHEPGRAA
jgi:hypothetical protein